MINLVEFCSQCSHIISLAGEYKQSCRNSDQLVCVDTCVHFCRMACVCASTGNLDRGMLTKLKYVCEWCNDLCSSMGLNQKRKCCQKFHSCCNRLIELSESDEADYHGAFDHIDERAIKNVAYACSKMYESGFTKRLLMLRDENNSKEQIGRLESCVEVCACINFVAENVCEHMDNDLLDSCMRLCHECVKMNCCIEESEACIKACTECAHRSNQEYDEGLPTDRTTTVDLDDIIRKLLH